MIGSDVQPLIFHGRNPCEPHHNAAHYELLQNGNETKPSFRVSTVSSALRSRARGPPAL
jgi:hypothetical protein